MNSTFGNRGIIVMTALALGFGAPALAAPFSYDFIIPGFYSNNDPAQFGTALLVTLTFENGNATNVSQTYAFDDVIAANASAIGGTFSIPEAYAQVVSYTGTATDTFGTTDAAGLITLLPPLVPNFTDATVKISIDGGDKYITFAGWFWSGTWGGAYTDEGGEAFGPLVPVPAPSALAGVFVAGAVLHHRRRRPD